MAIGHSRQRVLHDFCDPMLPLLGIARVGALHSLLKVTATARLHHQEEATLVFEVLEDADDVRMVQALQHCELLPDSLVRRFDLLGLGFADDLAHADDFGATGRRCLVSDLVDSPECSSSQLLALLVDVFESVPVFLQELLTPMLVALLACACLAGLDADIAFCQHEAQEPKEHGLEILFAHAAAGGAWLVLPTEFVKHRTQLLFSQWRSNV
mmetsp:Transcript_120371/g.312457  ORF Transcript_120371/g.312457 Transcript_120371/m.312457 type:complete len:212 (-) Transcript_120371:286-921(-)